MRAILLLIALAPLDGEDVAPGITYRERSFMKGDDGRFAMQILEVDPRHPAVNLLAARAKDSAIGRETTSSMARRLGATAAVNGGYFVTTGPYMGASSGVYSWNGEVVASGSGRSAMLFCEEKDDVEQVAFDVVNFSGKVTASDGASALISGLNRPRGAQDLVVFKPVMGPRTLTDGSGMEALVDSGGRVVKLNSAGNSEIPSGGYVLSGAGAGAEWMREHAKEEDRLALDLTLKASGPACPATAILGAGPRLVRAGQVAVASEGFAHEKNRNPRTAVAVTSRGTLLFVTLDGRQKHSVGMRLDEFAGELVALGAVEALNLDGGGSTAMVVRGEIRNSPSDGKERPVSDAILIYSVPDAAALQALREALAASGAAWARPLLLPEAERGVAKLVQ